MKKLFLLFLLLLPLSVFGFSDIKNSEFSAYITNMYNEKLISGYNDGTFRPNNPVNFIESIKIATNAFIGPYEVKYAVNWEDVYEEIYNRNAYQEEKIFARHDAITRDFAVYMIMRSLGIDLTGIPIPSDFSDVDGNSIFAPYINFAKNKGMINGFSDGTFRPHTRVTRGEFAKMAWTMARVHSTDLIEAYETGNLIANIQPNTIDPDKSSGIVTHITDGDTIKVKNQDGKIETLRIIGIDAPESFTTRFGYIECYGREASNFLKSYLPIGSTVQIKYYGDDIYNRDLAEISYNGRSISEIMIEKGYAWVYRDGISPDNYGTLLKMESIAQDHQIGLWSSYTCNGYRKAIIEETPKIPETTYTPATKSNNNTSTTTTTKSSSYKNSSSRSSFKVCYTGPRGGRYYINSKGKKVYDCD